MQQTGHNVTNIINNNNINNFYIGDPKPEIPSESKVKVIPEQPPTDPRGEP